MKIYRQLEATINKGNNEKHHTLHHIKKGIVGIKKKNENT